jgi:hypothetical protein
MASKIRNLFRKLVGILGIPGIMETFEDIREIFRDLRVFFSDTRKKNQNS